MPRRISRCWLHQANRSIVRKWLDNNKRTLSDISPGSGDAKFDTYLAAGAPENLPATRKKLYEEVMIPLQQQLGSRAYLETVETYLLALHWLLILDKVSKDTRRIGPI